MTKSCCIVLFYRFFLGLFYPRMPVCLAKYLPTNSEFKGTIS